MSNSAKLNKFVKTKKGKLIKLEFKTNKLKFGTHGLKAAESGMINVKQIEASYQAIVRKMKTKGKVWTRIFPNLAITSKPTLGKMGKGKGNVSHWNVRVAQGKILFEICGINQNIVFSSLKAGGAKLPLKTKIFF